MEKKMIKEERKIYIEDKKHYKVEKKLFPSPSQKNNLAIDKTKSNNHGIK